MDSQEEFATYVRKTSSRAKYVNYTVHTLLRLESVTMLIYITKFNFMIEISLKHFYFKLINFNRVHRHKSNNINLRNFERVGTSFGN